MDLVKLDWINWINKFLRQFEDSDDCQLQYRRFKTKYTSKTANKQQIPVMKEIILKNIGYKIDENKKNR